MDSASVQSGSQSQPRSYWVGWLAWMLIIIVLVWSFGIDFFLSELQLLSFSHMVIWALLLIISFVLFIVSLVNAISDFLQVRRAATVFFKKKFVWRIILSALGLVVTPVLIFIYGLLAFTVGSKF